MIRYLVGTMVEISRGKFEMENFIKLLKFPQENVHIFKAPAHGLVLSHVDYEEN